MPEGAVDRVRGISPDRQNSVYEALTRIATVAQGGDGVFSAAGTPTVATPPTPSSRPDVLIAKGDRDPSANTLLVQLLGSW
jgi:hypothetical protein